MLPVLEVDSLGIAHPHINSSAVEWQRHERDIWLTDHEYHLQIIVNTSHKHSQARHNIILHCPMLSAESYLYIMVGMEKLWHSPLQGKSNKTHRPASSSANKKN